MPPPFFGTEPVGKGLGSRDIVVRAPTRPHYIVAVELSGGELNKHGFVRDYQDLAALKPLHRWHVRPWRSVFDMPDMSGRGSRSKNDTAVLLPTSAISMIDSAYASSSRALSALPVMERKP